MSATPTFYGHGACDCQDCFKARIDWLAAHPIWHHTDVDGAPYTLCGITKWAGCHVTDDESRVTCYGCQSLLAEYVVRALTTECEHQHVQVNGPFVTCRTCGARLVGPAQ